MIGNEGLEGDAEMSPEDFEEMMGQVPELEGMLQARKTELETATDPARREILKQRSLSLRKKLQQGRSWRGKDSILAFRAFYCTVEA